MREEGKLVTNHVGKEFKGLRLKEGAQWFSLSPNSKVSGSNPQGGQGFCTFSLCPRMLNKAKTGSSLFLNGSSNTQLSRNKNI